MGEKLILGYTCDCDVKKGDILYLDKERNILTNDYEKIAQSQSEDIIIEVG